MFQAPAHCGCPGQHGDGGEADPHDVSDGRVAGRLQQAASGQTHTLTSVLSNPHRESFTSNLPLSNIVVKYACL